MDNMTIEVNVNTIGMSATDAKDYVDFCQFVLQQKLLHYDVYVYQTSADVSATINNAELSKSQFKFDALHDALNTVVCDLYMKWLQSNITYTYSGKPSQGAIDDADRIQDTCFIMVDVNSEINNSDYVNELKEHFHFFWHV